jgi:hypothetical protein
VFTESLMHGEMMYGGFIGIRNGMEMKRSCDLK